KISANGEFIWHSVIAARFGESSSKDALCESRRFPRHEATSLTLVGKGDCGGWVFAENSYDVIGMYFGRFEGSSLGYIIPLKSIIEKLPEMESNVSKGKKL